MIHVCKFCKAFFSTHVILRCLPIYLGCSQIQLILVHFDIELFENPMFVLSRPGKMYIGYFLIFTFHVSSTHVIIQCTPSLFGMFTNSINIGSS